jgi:hypothetical protein
MSQFQKFETSVLFEMLMFQSERLSQLFKATIFDKQYDECKITIEELHAEIERRRNFPINITSKDVSFKDGETTAS